MPRIFVFQLIRSFAFTKRKSGKDGILFKKPIEFAHLGNGCIRVQVRRIQTKVYLSFKEGQSRGRLSEVSGGCYSSNI